MTGSSSTWSPPSTAVGADYNSAYSYSSASSTYTCLPCWGGFDSQISPYTMGTTTTDGVISYPTDILQSSYVNEKYGTPGQVTDSSKLSNCASLMQSETAGTQDSYIWWAVADDAAAVQRGSYANSAWGTSTGAENIWPSNLTNPVAAGDLHILSIAFSAEDHALFAVTPTRLWISPNPSDYKGRVLWSVGTTLTGGSLFRGVATVPRLCNIILPSTFSSTSSVTQTVSGTVTNSPSRSPNGTYSNTVSVSPSRSARPSSSVSTTISPSAVSTPSLVPSAFTVGNVLLSRVEQVTDQLLSRVWIDEYNWDSSNPNHLAKRVQSNHFPHRKEYVSGTPSGINIDKSRLTLPFEMSRTLGLGQLTSSQDRCAFGIGGFDVGVDDLKSPTARSVFPSLLNVASVSSAGATNIGFNSAHNLLAGSAFVFTYLGTPALGGVAIGDKIVVTDVTTFTLTCSTANLSPVTFTWSGSFTTQPTILPLNLYTASKNSVSLLSSAAGSGFIDTQTGGFPGYRMSIARIGGAGWYDFFPYSTTKYEHWLPKNKWYASDVYMTTWDDVPRAVALTSVAGSGTSVSASSSLLHANSVYYSTGYTASSVKSSSYALSGVGDQTTYKVDGDRSYFAHANDTAQYLKTPNGAGGSIRGRCFEGVKEYVEQDWDQSSTSSTSYPWVGMDFASTKYSYLSSTTLSTSTGLGFDGTSNTAGSARIATSFKTSGSCTLSGATGLAYGCFSPYFSYKYSNGYQCTTSTLKRGCQCYSSDFVTVDPNNNDGTSGMCFVGPASSENRLLAVRTKTGGGNIYSWQKTQVNTIDQSCELSPRASTHSPPSIEANSTFPWSPPL